MAHKLEYLLDHCDTDRQLQVVQMFIAGRSGPEICAALGMGHRSTPDKVIHRLKRKAARRGAAPGHFEHGVAPGYRMRNVTVQRNADGMVERTWERQHPEAFESLLEALDERIERVEPLPEIKAPSAFGSENLMNQISVFDGHIGALAWHAETGPGNWDLDIARETIGNGIVWLAENLPAAQDLLFLVGGDFTEVDGYKNLTPESGNLLDADGRYPKIFAVAEDVIEAGICAALKIYNRVILSIRPGNHDKQTAFALRRVFRRVFRDNPRVIVDESLREYWAILFGKTMIACHHGDKAKLVELPGIFAADFAEMWGQSTYRVCHSGHWHFEKSLVSTGLEQRGMMLYQHPTLERRNAWASGKGLTAARQLVGHSYHRGGGLVTQLHFNPNLMAAAA